MLPFVASIKIGVVFMTQSPLVTFASSLIKLIQQLPFLLKEGPTIYRFISKVFFLYQEELIVRSFIHKPNNGINYSFPEMQLHGAVIISEWQKLYEEFDSIDAVVAERLKVLRPLSLFVRNDEEANKIRLISSMVHFRSPKLIYSLLASGVNPLELLLKFKNVPIMQLTILNMLPNIPLSALAAIDGSQSLDELKDIHGNRINIRDAITFELPSIPVSYQGVIYEFKYVTPELLNGRLGYAVGSEIDILKVQFELRAFVHMLRLCNNAKQSKFKTNALYAKNYIWHAANDIIKQKNNVQLYPSAFMLLVAQTIVIFIAFPLNVLWLVFASHRLATLANIGALIISNKKFGNPEINSKEYFKGAAISLMMSHYMIPAMLSNFGNIDDVEYFCGASYNNRFIALNIFIASLASAFAIYSNRNTLFALRENVTYDYKAAQESLVGDIEQSISLKPELANSKQMFFWKQVLDERTAAKASANIEIANKSEVVNSRARIALLS